MQDQIVNFMNFAKNSSCDFDLSINLALFKQI